MHEILAEHAQIMEKERGRIDLEKDKIGKVVFEGSLRSSPKIASKQYVDKNRKNKSTIEFMKTTKDMSLHKLK